MEAHPSGHHKGERVFVVAPLQAPTTENVLRQNVCQRPVCSHILLG